MLRLLIALPFLLLPAAARAQAIQPGAWDVASTLVDLTVPGAPGFLLRMAKGKSRAEHKCVSPDQAKAGIAALLAPAPKAQCRVDSFRAGGGTYAQSLTCPQQKGDPLHVMRAGSYDANGFTGHAEMTGRTPKGALSVVMTQRATRVGGTCHG